MQAVNHPDGNPGEQLASPVLFDGLAARHHYKCAAYGYHTHMNVSSKPERTRLSAEDWELAALHLIAEQGVGALAVEALARQLGVTKGSFYWHFRTREALLNAALERWEQYGEREIISEIEQIADPRKRLPELFRRVAHELQPHRVYAALLKALDHPQVVPVMARVSQRRMEFLDHCLPRGRPAAAGGIEPGAADLRRLRRFPAAELHARAAADQPRGIRGLRGAHDRDPDSGLIRTGQPHKPRTAPHGAVFVASCLAIPVHANYRFASIFQQDLRGTRWPASWKRSSTG